MNRRAPLSLLAPTLLAAMPLVACGGASSAGPTVGHAAGGGDAAGSLDATLQREVGAGASVAIVAGPSGLRAISSDGARERTLVPGPVPWALVDHRAHVVWFGSADRTEVRAIDLTAPATATPVAETIVTGADLQTDAGQTLWGVRYPGRAGGEPDELSFGHPIGPHALLELADPPSLHASSMILAMWDQLDAFEAQVQTAQVVGGDLVAAWAQRGTDGTTNPGGALAERPAVSVDLSECDEPDQCGLAQELDGTGLWRVATAFSCGDGCYTDWRLYDPSAQRLRDEPWANLIADAWVAPDGTAFVTNGAIVRFDRGPLPTTPLSDGEDPDRGGGWLGGGQYVGF
ncbi:MAG: hypothetical protein R2939_10370 [Kofleriaceae bacterium]